MGDAIVVTFGTFDLFHRGHVNILQRAAELGSTLIVGISTDELNYNKKQRYPTICYADRAAIVAAMGCVDCVFPEESLELKRKYLVDMEADVLVMGDDWEGRFDEFNDICKVVYLPRTPLVSTTIIRARMERQSSPM